MFIIFLLMSELTWSKTKLDPSPCNESFCLHRQCIFHNGRNAWIQPTVQPPCTTPVWCVCCCGRCECCLWLVLWGQSWRQGVFIWPRVCIIDAHYHRHCQLQTLHGGRRCQVNVSLTSNRTDSQNASVLPGVYLCDKWACTRKLITSRESFVSLHLIHDVLTPA